MPFIVFLIFFPFLAALALLGMKKDSALRSAVVIASSLLIMAVCVLLGAMILTGKLLPGAVAGDNRFLLPEYGTVPSALVMAGEVVLMCAVIYYGLKHRRYYCIVLSLLQTLPVLWLDLSGRSEEASSALPYFRIDEFTALMCIIVGVVGGFICIYAVGYIRDYHHHHTGYKDRSGWFLAMLFVFLGAMFGLLLSDNLGFMYFFWEITSVCSFLLIGYNYEKQSINNSFKALWMNLLGGLGFACAILYSVLRLNIIHLSLLVSDTSDAAKAAVLIPVALLAFAALTKSAQMPFSGWLLGAMVAPTPTSALLHSATMVKAGVYLLMRLAPVLNGTVAGLMVTIIAGFTFFVASLMAIATSDGKRVLAHSTVSNLGLIAACAGVGTAESVWAGTMLIVFHAVSKSLMFLCVGAYENATGSRNIEDMHGMLTKFPRLAMAMGLGICGMSLAPFGMLISKWAALKAFVDEGNAVLVLFLVYGSATTTFYWTKWLAKIFAVLHHSEPIPVSKIRRTEWGAIYPLTGIVSVLMFFFPLISSKIVIPVVSNAFGGATGQAISSSDMRVIIVMLIILAIVPVFGLLANKIREDDKDYQTAVYMGGANAGDDRHFINSYGEQSSLYMANWYITDWFGELVLMKPALLLSSAALVIFMIIALTGGMI